MLQKFDVEVDKQSNAFISQFQIRQQLRFMNRGKTSDGFYFNDNRIFS